MPLTQLNFQPGLDTENTETGADTVIDEYKRPLLGVSPIRNM